jgi:hypothetical protein
VVGIDLREEEVAVENVSGRVAGREASSSRKKKKNPQQTKDSTSSIGASDTSNSCSTSGAAGAGAGINIIKYNASSQAVQDEINALQTAMTSIKKTKKKVLRHPFKMRKAVSFSERNHRKHCRTK